MRLLLSLTLLQLSVFSFGQTPTKPVRIDADSLLEAKIGEAIGKPFPTFVAANEQGKINNDSLKGKVVLINFWFEGCHPCLEEFGALNELAEKLKGNKDFEFISFTWDNAETIKRVKEKYQLQFKVFYSKECSRLNLKFGYPTTIILDRQGIIKYLVCGGSLDPEKAREFVMTTLLPKVQQEL
jgi:cytochrome c biogenesis protein CcmG, thiol:disulfide interchange protein DsbE